MVGPIAGERVIDVPGRQGRIFGKQIDDGG
jgi:hypothetical protein